MTYTGHIWLSRLTLRSSLRTLRRYSLHKRGAIGKTAPMAETPHPRHSGLVRVTHWLITFAFLALLVSGLEIVVSHPRFYWGEVGNVNTPALFKIPVHPRGIWSPRATVTFFRTRTAGAAISISNPPGYWC